MAIASWADWVASWLLASKAHLPPGNRFFSKPCKLGGLNMRGLTKANLRYPQSYPKVSKQTVRLFDGAFACFRFQVRWGMKSKSFASALLAAFLRDSSTLLLDRGKTSMFKNTFALPEQHFASNIRACGRSQSPRNNAEMKQVRISLLGIFPTSHASVIQPNMPMGVVWLHH